MTRAWVEVDLGALRRNGAAMAARGAPILPMIKADAYGLGAEAAVRALDPLEPWGYGVATVDEGTALRAFGVERPIIVFTPLVPDDFADAVRARLTPALSSADAIAHWRAAGGGPWHLAIDTGMHRAGVRWDAVDTVRDAAADFPPEGVFTHFHSAELDDGSRGEQERRFAAALARLPVRPPYVHCENSAALARTTHSAWTLARPGVFLYGVGSGPHALVQPDPVVAVRARIAELRTVCAGESVSYDATYRAPSTRRVATLPIGYADGYRRALGNCGTVLVSGRRVPVVGVVTMDMTMVDVTGVSCAVGDVATLIGRDGSDAITVEDVAHAASLSPYEVLTGLRSRLPRHYLPAGT